eukprot:Lithocolla_globosa_v1_NODE_2236_length_2095_cov_59.551471.p2 type:complete len:106 gc:universal NODE_2236_length_2095_cov_59.551471:720-1037(+)
MMHSNFNVIFEFSDKTSPENRGQQGLVTRLFFHALSNIFPESPTVSGFHAVIFKLFSSVIQKKCHQRDRLLHARTQKLKLMDTLLTQQTNHSMQNISIIQSKMRT